MSAAGGADRLSGSGLKRRKDGLSLLAVEMQVQVIAVGVFNVQAAVAVGDLKLSCWSERGRCVAVHFHWFG